MLLKLKGTHGSSRSCIIFSQLQPPTPKEKRDEDQYIPLCAEYINIFIFIWDICTCELMLFKLIFQKSWRDTFKDPHYYSHIIRYKKAWRFCRCGSIFKNTKHENYLLVHTRCYFHYKLSGIANKAQNPGARRAKSEENFFFQPVFSLIKHKPGSYVFKYI